MKFWATLTLSLLSLTWCYSEPQTSGPNTIRVFEPDGSPDSRVRNFRFGNGQLTIDGSTAILTITGGSGSSVWYYVSKATDILDLQNQYAITGATSAQMGYLQVNGFNLNGGFEAGTAATFRNLGTTRLGIGYDSISGPADVFIKANDDNPVRGRLHLSAGQDSNAAPGDIMIHRSGAIELGRGGIAVSTGIKVGGVQFTTYMSTVDAKFASLPGGSPVVVSSFSSITVSSVAAPTGFALITVTTSALPNSTTPVFRMDTGSMTYTGRKLAIFHPRMGRSAKFGINDDETGLNEFQIGGDVQLPLTFYDNGLRTMNMGTNGDFNMPLTTTKFTIGDEVGCCDAKLRVEGGSIASAGNLAGLSIATSRFNVHSGGEGVSIGTNFPTVGFRVNLDLFPTPQMWVTYGNQMIHSLDRSSVTHYVPVQVGTATFTNPPNPAAAGGFNQQSQVPPYQWTASTVPDNTISGSSITLVNIATGPLIVYTVISSGIGGGAGRDISVVFYTGPGLTAVATGYSVLRHIVNGTDVSTNSQISAQLTGGNIIFSTHSFQLEIRIDNTTNSTKTARYWISIGSLGTSILSGNQADYSGTIRFPSSAQITGISITPFNNILKQNSGTLLGPGFHASAYYSLGL